VFAHLEAVVAVPLLNLAGRPVGVLSAAGDGEPDPAEEDELVTEYPNSFSSQAEAARQHLRTHPRLVRLTPGRRDRILREVRAERAERAAEEHSPPSPRRWFARSA
jgi:hypothetical protein